MKIAFYKNGGTFFDKLIRFITKGKYSHCELIFDQICKPDSLMWFTSSPRDGGVRFKNIKPIPSHWDIIDIKVNLRDEQFVFDWANSQIGKKYNWIGCARFVFKFLPNNDNKWFCSQICIATLQEIALLRDKIADDSSPQDFYNYVK